RAAGPPLKVVSRGSLGHDRPDLQYDPSPVYAWPGPGDRHRLVDVGRLQQRVAGEDLLGLHERAVGHPVRPDRLGLVRPVELVPGVGELAGSGVFLIPGSDLRHPGLEIRRAEPLACLGDRAKHQVFHFASVLQQPGTSWRPLTDSTNRGAAVSTWSGSFSSGRRIPATPASRGPAMPRPPRWWQAGLAGFRTCGRRLPPQ